MNIVEQIGQDAVNASLEQRPVPEFGAGDTLRISVRVVEGSRERIQAFEGVCIARKNKGISSSFTVRKISYGEGVERIFHFTHHRYRRLKFFAVVVFVVLSYIIFVAAQVKQRVSLKRQEQAAPQPLKLHIM